MIYVGPLRVDEVLAARTRTLLQSPEGVEGAIAFLRREGESKIGTIRMLVATAGFTLREAKRVVHYSPAWQDRRSNDDAFHDSLVRVVQELQACDSELVEVPLEAVSTR